MGRLQLFQDLLYVLPNQKPGRRPTSGIKDSVILYFPCLVAFLDAPQGFHLTQYKGFPSGLSVMNVRDSISFLASGEPYSSRPAHSISCPNTSSEVDGRGEVAKRDAKEERDAKHRLSQTKLLTAFGLLEPASTFMSCVGR